VSTTCARWLTAFVADERAKNDRRGGRGLDEKELLRQQIKAFEFYAGLIDRAVGGGAQAKLPRWDEQRALEYRALAEQLRERLAELEAAEPGTPVSNGTEASATRR
jgi:hypothetical protein